MKRSIVLCKSSSDRPGSTSETRDQSLDSITCVSESRSQLGCGGENLTDAFNLALGWPAVAEEVWGEGKLSCTRQDSPARQPRNHIRKASPKASYSYINSLPPYGMPGDVYSHSVGIDSVDHNATTALGDNKRLFLDGNKSGRQKRRKVGKVTYLPLEIISTVISQVIVTKPTCALDLVVPDWRICNRETPQLEKSLGVTRIMTYTRGVRFQRFRSRCSRSKRSIFL
ncbi:hypothetical protein F5B18DRAFT_612969 [Nemania serpens]|nr:hypothetical protein F5B18DRAFT_612969 [Nemania serpens]